MKKLIFNGTLGHKQSEYRPMTIEVEKVVELRGKEFKNLMEHTLRDNPHVKACRDIMYISGKTAHCVLFLDADSKDGIIVEAEGADYARKSQFIPNARAVVEYSEFTPMEKQLHGILKGMADKIAELAHAGYKSFFFEKMLGDTDIKSVMLSAVGQFLEQRGDMQSVRIHDLDIAGQPEFTVEPKQTNKLKFYSPLVVEREADYETDWNSSGDLEQLSENEKIKCCTKINEAIRQSFDSKEERRGLMEYYNNEHSAVNEKIYSAFPSVEDVDGTLMGVLTCEIVGNLTRSELEEVRGWWSSQCSDGWSDCLEQNGIKTEEFGDIYVHFGNAGNAWSIKTEAELKGIAETADTEETENLDADITKLYNFCKYIGESEEYIMARAKLECLMVIICGFKISELKKLRIQDVSDSIIDDKMKMVRCTKSECIDTFLKIRADFTDSKLIKSDVLFLTQRGN